MINIADILKQVPKGTKLWSNIFGDVEFNCIDDLNDKYPIACLDASGDREYFTEHGYFVEKYEECGECTLWPSKDHRAWDDEAYKILGIEKKPEAPFGLQPFDRVLVRNYCGEEWHADFFSHIYDSKLYRPYICVGCHWKNCIPYNEETKHLLGINQEPPEKYRQ